MSRYLFSIDNVHDHAAFQHACEAGFDGEIVGVIAVGDVAVGGR